MNRANHEEIEAMSRLTPQDGGASKIVKNATLKVYTGAPHGMCTTLKDKVNADLLAFFQGVS